MRDRQPYGGGPAAPVPEDLLGGGGDVDLLADVERAVDGALSVLWLLPSPLSAIRSLAGVKEE
ncbi:hypothetical protein ACIRQP_35900 [Streptomyces sp. NPDC102274]|uniref:hypothetical protein n=1 Tax=Streptomyces sp. NPDC102274 TaxID=3366151 RepID=UPI00381EE2D8